MTSIRSTAVADAGRWGEWIAGQATVQQKMAVIR